MEPPGIRALTLRRPRFSFHSSFTTGYEPISGSHLTRQAEDSKSIAKTSQVQVQAQAQGWLRQDRQDTRTRTRNDKKPTSSATARFWPLRPTPALHAGTTTRLQRQNHPHLEASPAKASQLRLQGTPPVNLLAAGGPEAQYNEPEFKDRWQVFTWTVGTPSSSHFSHNFKYEKTINNPDCPYELRPVDDWFEPGTPRQ